MIALLKLWLDKAWGYLLVGVAVLLGLMTIRQSGKAAGKQEAEREQHKAAAAARERAREVDNEVDSLGDGAVRDRAGRWVRDNRK